MPSKMQVWARAGAQRGADEGTTSGMWFAVQQRMATSSNRMRQRRHGTGQMPDLQPSDIANAILDLSNQAEWTKLAIGKLKPTHTDPDAAAANDANDEGPEDGPSP